jgi:hypothetical protein
MPYCSAICLPILVSVSWKAGRQCMNLDLRIAAGLHQRGVHLVLHQQADALLPHFLGLAHGDPDVGVDEVDAFDRLSGRR